MTINDITTLQMMVRGRQLTTHQRDDAFQELERVEKFIKSNQLQQQEVSDTDLTDTDLYNFTRLHDWLIEENREPAQTKFTAGLLRNVAKEIEYQIKIKK